MKDDFIDGVRAAIKKAVGEAAEEHKVYPGQTEVRDIVGILRNSALFSRHRLVILNEAHLYKKAADARAIADYCAAPAPDATLILVTDEYRVDSRIEKTVSKDRRKIFWEMFDNKKRAWVRDYFQKSGLSVTADAVEMLLELVENDTQDLRRECEKLVLFFGSGATIDAEKIEELIYHSKDENVFTLFERLAGRDLEGSLEVLHAMRLSGGGDPVQTMGGLTWQLRRLMSYAYLIDEGFSPDEACKRVKILGKKNQATYRAALGTYRTAEIEHMVMSVAEYEEYLRSTASDAQNLFLELFLYQCIQNRRLMAHATETEVLA